MAKQDAEDAEQVYISPAELARRWRMSRTGAVRIAEKAGVRSVFLGNRPRSTRRFRLIDITRYEDSATE